jgi:hypothetical protein
LDKICLLNESCDNVTDIDIEYDHFECEVSKVIDKHVPVKQDLLLLVSITSTNDGLQSFLKQVGSLIIFVRSKISHKSSSVCERLKIFCLKLMVTSSRGRTVQIVVVE